MVAEFGACKNKLPKMRTFMLIRRLDALESIFPRCRYIAGAHSGMNSMSRGIEMMAKSDTIDEIMRLNPSVGATFLSEFPNEELKRYLLRLRELHDRPFRRVQAIPLHTSNLPRPVARQCV